MSLSEHLSRIAKTVGTGAKIAAKKSGDIVEITKLNLAIGAAEDKIKDAYAAMGKMVFERYEGYEVSDEANVHLCKQVIQQKGEIEGLRLRINEIRSTKVCSHCGAVINENESFCSKCGERP